MSWKSRTRAASIMSLFVNNCNVPDLTEEGYDKASNNDDACDKFNLDRPT